MSADIYFFEDIDDLVSHVIFLHGELSSVKLQKTLYFLYAIYGGMYASSTKQNMPGRLFDALFEAWHYGPVIRQVYNQNKEPDGYKPKEYVFENDKVSQAVKRFVNSVSKQVVALSDFDLVDRSHEDSAYQTAIALGHQSIIDNDGVINEYKEHFN